MFIVSSIYIFLCLHSLFWPIVRWALLGTLAAINCLNARTQMQICRARKKGRIWSALEGGVIAGARGTTHKHLEWRQRSDSRFRRELRTLARQQRDCLSLSLSLSPSLRCSLHSDSDLHT